MPFKEGQKLLYLTTKGGHPHIEVVTFMGGTNFDQYDVISTKLYTKEQILEMFNVKICVCPSSPPGVLLDDGTCGNCGGVVKPLFETMKCPRCGKITTGRKGNRCDHCNTRIPLCYGVVAPRTQDCANCVYAKECLEEQKRPVPVEEITDDPDLQESIRRCREEQLSKSWRGILSPDELMMETWNCPKCGRVELIIYKRCQSCGHDRDESPLAGMPDKFCPYCGHDVDWSSPTAPLSIVLPCDHEGPDDAKFCPTCGVFIKEKIQANSILCPNCKQPVEDKYEHSESDYDGDSVSQWWECPQIEETKEEDP